MLDRRKRLMLHFFLANAVTAATIAIFLLIAFLKLPIFNCIAYEFFHLYCPLCGGTRAILALIELDFVSALKYNPFIFYLAFAAIVYDVKVLICARQGKADAFAVPRWLIWISAAAFVLFFVGRNLDMIAWGIDPIGDLVKYWSAI